MQIFEVYEGKIAIFPVSDEQIDLQTEFIEPIHVKILAITRKIRHYQELAAPGTGTDGFHVGKGAKEVFAVFLADFFGFPAHATQNFNAGNHVVAVKPGSQGIFAATEQNGTVTFFGKDAIEIVYPKCDTAPCEKR